MTQKETLENPTPRAKQPFNQKLRAFGHSKAPEGSLRHDDSEHFRMQEWIGIFATLAVFFAIVYGITRDVADSGLAVGAVAAGMILAPVMWPAKRRRRQRRDTKS